MLLFTHIEVNSPVVTCRTKFSGAGSLNKATPTTDDPLAEALGISSTTITQTA